MTRYFVAANVWLIIALITFLGRTHERVAASQVLIFSSWGMAVAGHLYSDHPRAHCRVHVLFRAYVEDTPSGENWKANHGLTLMDSNAKTQRSGAATKRDLATDEH